jgi:hypothetical protein
LGSSAAACDSKATAASGRPSRRAATPRSYNDGAASAGRAAAVDGAAGAAIETAAVAAAASNRHIERMKTRSIGTFERAANKRSGNAAKVALSRLSKC